MSESDSSIYGKAGGTQKQKKPKQSKVGAQSKLNLPSLHPTHVSEIEKINRSMQQLSARNKTKAEGPKAGGPRQASKV